MSQIPLAVPNAAGQTGPVDMDELARLEAQRGDLLARVADQDRVRAKVHARLGLLAPGVMIGLVVLVFVWLRSGEMAVPTAVLTLVIGGPLLFVLARRVRTFGTRFLVAEPDARDLLAECEAGISRLKERRS
jgi:hypothetical protein